MRAYKFYTGIPGFLVQCAFLLSVFVLTAFESRAFRITASVVTNDGCDRTIRVTWAGAYNGCVTDFYNDVRIFVNNNEIYYGSWRAADGGLSGAHSFSFTQHRPGAVLNIHATIRHIGWWCDYTVTSNTVAITVPPLRNLGSPITGIRADDNRHPDRVHITWDPTAAHVCYLLRYQVLSNGVAVSPLLPAYQRSFVHTGLPPGVTNTYTVRALANEDLVHVASISDQGSTFALGLRASNNRVDNVLLQWNNFAHINQPEGFIIRRWNGEVDEVIADSRRTDITSHTDRLGLIPGFWYRYTMTVDPVHRTLLNETVWGRIPPNGRIRGTIRTPATATNPLGVPVPNIRVVAKLQGPALPTDTTTTYFAYTNSQGEFEIRNVYYFTSATFTVRPVGAGRVFYPVSRDVTLTSGTPETANFTDNSSYVVSGTILQGTCPAAGVQLLLNGNSTGVKTGADGRYHLPILIGGTHTIKPVFENNTFHPANRTLVVANDLTGINFSDATTYILEGRLTASCNAFIGVANIRFYSYHDNGVCFSRTVTTDATGYYSVEVPARKLGVSMLDFTSINEQLLGSATVLAHFSNITQVDLTHYNPATFRNDTTTLNFTYRTPPTLEMLGLDMHVTCSGEPVPVVQQERPVEIKFRALDSFHGSSCPAEEGHIVIRENISSPNMDFIADTIPWAQGDTLIRYELIPGMPNIIAPHKKSIQAEFVRWDNQRDTVYSDVIVVGHRPRSQTFTTTTPEIPLHIIHNPPGDGSYSYLEKNTSISNSIATSFLKEGTVDTYVRAQFWPTVFMGVGVGKNVSIEFRSQFDVTGTLGTGSSRLTEDVTTFTSTTGERFQTAGNVDIIGGAGDVYIGGALNMLYAVSDVVRYNFDLCRIETDVTLVMKPTGFATTFMYTEEHILNTLIPELRFIADYYTQRNVVDSAKFFRNQLQTWEQFVARNHENIANARKIENLSISGGVLYESWTETVRTQSQSIDFYWFVDGGVAVETGLSVSGVGVFMGIAVRGRLTMGEVSTKEETEATRVGYVLSDDDLGDVFSVDVLENRVYGVPVFRLVGGKSSCPWEPGTLPREGVQLTANTYSREVEESETAVFTLQLGNLSESDETRTYDLIFDHASNPHGAVIHIGGSPIVGNVPYPYTIGPRESATVTITVRRGPIEDTYRGLKFILQSPCDEAIRDEILLDVTFYREFNLAVGVSGSGTTNIAGGNNPFREGTRVALLATPSAGYVFHKWVVGTNEYFSRAIEVLMDGNQLAVAHFVPMALPQLTLSVASSGNGTTLPAPGTHVIISNSTVTLTAIPDSGSAFVRWVVNGTEYTDPEIQVVISANSMATAYFVEGQRTSVAHAIGSANANIRVYPNPTTGLLNIYSANPLKDIVVVDLTGNTVYRAAHVNARSLTLNLESLKPGAYIIRLTTQHDATSRKVILK